MKKLISGQDILNLINDDKWMLKILKLVKKLELLDWMVGAGFVRSKVWDYLHDYKTKTPLGDIDVIYFDRNNINKDQELVYERKLKGLYRNVNWSVKNQARMHLVNKDKPYKSSEDALSKWPETATCIAVKINNKGKLVLIAPHGIGDLINLVVKPTPVFKNKLKKYKKRANDKQWKRKWPKLKILLS